MKASFNRGTGLLVFEVRNSNPNGDPDQESDPRTLDADGRGVISPPSVKRKARDLVLANGEVMAEAREKLNDLKKYGNDFGILEARDRKRDEIWAMDAPTFQKKFWDARVFGNTFLESLKSKPDAGTSDGNGGTKPKKKSKTAEESAKRDTAHFISTGVVQVGVGLSVAPVEIDRMTNTNKSGVEEGKDRGMAPLGFRVVRHGVYYIPFFVNPSLAVSTGATDEDIALLKFLLPHLYNHTASAIRPFITVLHAWYGEHKNRLGSCPDSLLIDALTPRLKETGSVPSDLSGYVIPSGEEDAVKAVRTRFDSITDLCV